MFSNTTPKLFTTESQQNLFSFTNLNNNFTGSQNSENSQNDTLTTSNLTTSNLFSSELSNENNLKQQDTKVNIVNSEAVDNEINELKKSIDDFKNDIKKEMIELKNLLIKNNNNGIYVKCSLHEHLLKEQTIHNLKGVYLNGFVCDHCGYKQQNVIEKFYNCNECKSNLQNGQGGFDLCITCVKNSL